ncbi:MAG: glycine cleavage system protein GcvH [Gammaproteobacteria bacterium]
MSDIPKNLKFAKSHEWARAEDDGTVTIGISDHAQGALGDLVFVEPPGIGDTIEANSACAVVESVKAASDVYSPIAGTVVAVNDLLDSTPELVNSDPYGKGWLFRMRPDGDDALGALLDADAYAKVVADEEH